MRIDNLHTDETVLAELGARLARTRLERNVSQQELATEAGVSKSTVERLEGGRAVRMNGFIRILRALDRLDALDRLLPEPPPSPIERLRLQGRRRQRAAGTRSRRGREETRGWSWGDGAPAGSES